MKCLGSLFYHTPLFLEVLYENLLAQATTIKDCVKPHLDSVFIILANLTTFLCSLCEPHPNFNLFPILMNSNQGEKQQQNNLPVWPVDIKSED